MRIPKENDEELPTFPGQKKQGRIKPKGNPAIFRRLQMTSHQKHEAHKQHVKHKQHTENVKNNPRRYS